MKLGLRISFSGERAQLCKRQQQLLCLCAGHAAQQSQYRQPGAIAPTLHPALFTVAKDHSADSCLVGYHVIIFQKGAI
ncbi:hypothetical protein, partial [Thiolapillus sp.]|uniref:hypothetical protein n=1 Tax=Thiolapillus sp. TaxID=2017437 RepID=UPI0025D6A316